MVKKKQKSEVMPGKAKSVCVRIQKQRRKFFGPECWKQYQKLGSPGREGKKSSNDAYRRLASAETLTNEYSTSTNKVITKILDKEIDELLELIQAVELDRYLTIRERTIKSTDFIQVLLLNYNSLLESPLWRYINIKIT
ncbi:hypothetical protein F8M41_010416 [Gigaspora margarita]|uniref:Uncharacterized protein n=1 Tax=Gigaspora margarita TaxID=4874 RepID=A0A8H4AUE1_GIGMA|nr:hypothetical protein F8M41_010416 [Gigaspora margarita]